MLTLEQLPDDPTPTQIRLLDRDSLDAIPYERRRWCCAAKGCTNGTHVRDYGIAPWYFLDRGSKQSREKPYRYWYRVPFTWWACGRHNKAYRRLLKAGFSHPHIMRRLFDLDGDLARYLRPV